MVSSAQQELWIKTYLTEKHKDPHAVFSERTLLTRHEAKRLCYIIMCSFDFLRGMIDDLSDLQQKVNTPRVQPF